MREYSENVMSVSVSRSDSYSESDEEEVSTVGVGDYEPQSSNVVGLPSLDAIDHGTTIVNMTNSSNVEVKPITQYMGPVTIHQYLNRAESLDQQGPVAALSTISENISKTVNDNVELPKEPVPNRTLHSPKEKLYHAMTLNLSRKLGCILILGVTIMSVALVVYFTVPKKDYHNDSTVTSPPDDQPNLDLGNDIHIMTRGRWGGRPILDGWQNRKLVHPVKLIVIAHTATSQCKTTEQCSSQLQTIQANHVGKYDYIDIGINFLVGGDGNIYEALGWDIRNYVKNNTIEISFLGNYVWDPVTDRQRMAVQLLLDRGIELGKVDENYFLVAHSQVYNTESPGRILLNEIKKWPHYDNRTYT